MAWYTSTTVKRDQGMHHWVKPGDGAARPACGAKVFALGGPTDERVPFYTNTCARCRKSVQKAFHAYVQACEDEGLNAHTLRMWVVYGSPRGPLEA